MSIEKAIADQTAAIADQTAAIKENTVALQTFLAAYQAGGAVSAAAAGKGAAATGKNTGKNDADKDNADDGAAADPIYWHIPGTEEFGTVDTEAEWKKLKKAKAKAVKIPESKYQTLVDAASDTNDGDTAEYSDRILALIDGVAEEPEEADIVELFKKYLPKDLGKDERDARHEIIKPILAGVKATKATAVKDEDRRDVIIAVIKGIEFHLEETGQVSDDEDEGLV